MSGVGKTDVDGSTHGPVSKGIRRVGHWSGVAAVFGSVCIGRGHKPVVVIGVAEALPEARDFGRAFGGS